MNLLNKYLFSQFVKYFFTVNSAFVSIYLLVDFFEKFDDFQNGGKPLSLAMEYFLFTIPFIVDQLGPVFILLAGVISLGILNHSNEFTALKAGGIPLRLIIRPILSASLLFTMLFLAAAQWLVPVTNARTNHIWFEQLKGKVPLGIMRENRYYYKGKEGFYSFNWPNQKQFIFPNFSYSKWDDRANLHTLVTAEFADWLPDRKAWVLKTGQVQQQDGKGGYVIVNFELKMEPLKESPEDFLIPENQAAEMSLSDLFLATEQADTDHQRQKTWATFLGRISYLVLGIPLLFIGLPILLYSYRKWGRDLSVAIPVSCGLAFLAWGIWGALQSLAITGYISPIIAAVALHLFFLLSGLVLLAKNDR